MKKKLLNLSLFPIGAGVILYITGMILNIDSSIPYILSIACILLSIVVLRIRTSAKE
ncbi:hypothetical protein [Floccifex porci]|uniref:hypothetical protein n=1 Tax=Floccifex porci TaxID=2606629 RepID=UPI0012B28C72|nr:hypothetical protein [Floccifex porci]